MIAIIGVGLGACRCVSPGAYRWWVARRETLKMAEEHRLAGQWNSSSTKDLEDMRAFSLHELGSNLESAKALKILDEEMRAVARQSGKPPCTAEEPVTPAEEIAWAEYRIESEMLDAQIAALREFAEWHRGRAEELQHRWIVNLQRERARDRAQIEYRRRQTGRLFSKKDNRMSVLADHCAELEEARARQLIERVGSHEATLAPDSPEDEGIFFHEQKAREFRRKAQSYRNSASEYVVSAAEQDDLISARLQKLTAPVGATKGP
ncbi:MAG TPA: hypothetical protein VGZ22_13820 [Isosphaeraceae bacterium]|nr:hypothetical protein [Isosphaeraceae bacterium]